VTEDDLVTAIRYRVSNDAGAAEARPSRFVVPPGATSG